MVLPLGHLAVRAAENEAPLRLASSDRVVASVIATLRLATTVTALAVVIGVAVGWLVERSDLPARRLFGVVLTLPLVVPTYVGALAIKAAVGPLGLAAEVPGVIGFWGATLALTMSTFPYVALTVRGALSTLDPAIEEAARTLGDNPRSAFVRAVIPQLRAAIAAGGLLVFLYVLSDFGAVSIMRVDTLTRVIFLEFRGSFDRSRPAVLGVLLIVVTLFVIIAERRLRGRVPVQVARGSGRRPTRPVALGPWRIPALGLALLIGLAGIGTPVMVLLYWATAGASGTGPVDILARAAATSAGLSAAAAVAAVVLAIPVAVAAVRFRSITTRLIETLATAGFALPGLVIGLALVFFAARYVTFLYQTYALVIGAYVIRFLPEALGSVRSSLGLVDPAVEDAGRTLGRGRLAVLTTITLPMVRPGLVAGGALVFLTAMKELPATLLLRPAGADTLAVRVWTGASEGFYGQAARPALLLLAVSALMLWPLRGSTERTVQ